ncbi:MAG: PriCT-2 domain-containing protein [Ferruginibacter sp.]|nr:PriCT-2 domain-containing protein [Ferruginibacter sp.]
MAASTTSIISIYKNIHDATSQDTIPIDMFLHGIQSGKWQDLVLKIRCITDKEIRRAEKSKCPYVTVSGIFGEKRSKESMKLHSGFISMDIDNLGNELEGVKNLLTADPYVYCCFVSISGTGLCVLFKIDTEKHSESFDGIADYLIKKYQIIIDPSGRDNCRPRFVSFDPFLYINDKSLLFKKYLPKPKAKKITSTIFVKTEFDSVVNEMVKSSVSCVEDYRDWRDIAFGLADQFGEAGRQYFHQLSSCSAKYETSMCDKQYTHALRHKSGGSKITIATIYWHAKQAGINVYTEKTKRIAAVTSTQKKAGLNAAQIADNLEKFEGITKQDADDIIRQAFAANHNFSGSESLVENLRSYLRCTYQLRRNVITRKIENSGNIIDEIELNTMYLDCKILFDELNFDMFCKVLFSKNTPDYNPLLEFLQTDIWDGHCRIEQLAKCINSNTGTEVWRERMLMKWLVGIIHSMQGGKNELNFIIVGGKNTGKTEFFRRLLPSALHPYFAESQLNRGKDDEILMCEKLVVFNDEYGGKNKMDERNEKRLMASDEFSLREPYGKANVTLKRLANLCGSCNGLDVLDDATGNRRIIVMEAAGRFNYELYNELDKQQLFFEAYELWKEGERPILKDEDIEEMEASTEGQYSKVSFEGEMIMQFMESPEKTNPWDFMTTTQIKTYLETQTKDKINLNKLGAQLRKLGYKRSNQKKMYGYDIAIKK